VHEIVQVLLSTSQIYQFHLDRLKAATERCHYEFFGLTEEATDAEVDRAYKKLAKQMHPDKNGGTEDAKEAFQQMKQKYEALKERRANQDGDGPKQKTSKCSKSSDDESEERADDEAEPKEEKRKEAYDEDEESEAPPTKKESGQISYDPTDQDSLATTALEMLQRLKAIEGSMSTVMSQLRQNGL
jgi:molecular chaperone DnaJ